MIGRRCSSLLAGIALLAAAAAPALAQDGSATPDATPGSGAAVLSELGYPELMVTATDDAIGGGMAGTPSPGLTLLTFTNDTGVDADLEVYAVGDDAGYDELERTFSTLDPTAMGPPPLFYELNISGGVGAGPGETASVVIDLQPGVNAVNYFASPDDGPPSNRMFKLEVTGEATDFAEPEPDVVAEMFEMDFSMPDEIPAGPLVWEIDNTGEQPHFILLSRYPEPFTEDDVMALLMTAGPGGPPEGTPAPGALDFMLFEDAFESPVMSGGNRNWYEIDLEPGYYVALCFIPDPETGAPHALMGMYEVFTVV